MDAGALTAIPVLLAGVLLVSGALKFGDRGRTAAAMLDLRVPYAARLAWAAPLVPWLEVALAVALVALPGGGLALAGWASAVLFAALTVLVARAAARPEPVHCNCFGALSTDPVGWSTALRNVVLTAAAVSVGMGVAGSDGVVQTVAGFDHQSTTWFAVVLGFAAAQALLWFGLRPRAARKARPAASAGSPGSAGSTAADATQPLDLSAEELVTASGAVVTLRELGRARAQLLVFVSAECHACAAVIASLPEWTDAVNRSVDLRLASASPVAALASTHPGAAAHAHYGTRGLRTLLDIAAFPAAALVGRDLTLAAGPVFGSDEIEALVGGIAEALNRSGPGSAPPTSPRTAPDLPAATAS